MNGKPKTTGIQTRYVFNSTNCSWYCIWPFTGHLLRLLGWAVEHAQSHREAFPGTQGDMASHQLHHYSEKGERKVSRDGSPSAPLELGVHILPGSGARHTLGSQVCSALLCTLAGCCHCQWFPLVFIKGDICKHFLFLAELAKGGAEVWHKLTLSTWLHMCTMTSVLKPQIIQHSKSLPASINADVVTEAC